MIFGEFLCVLLYDYFTIGCDPTVEENYKYSLKIDGKTTMLDVVDTPGIDCESFPRYYKQGDGFMIVYAVDNIITFEEAKNHCVNLLKSKQGIDVPIIIIANKWDYEDQRWVISRQQGQDLAAAFNAKYFETSAASSIGITEAFAAMVRMLRETKQPPVPNENNQKCIVF